MQIALVGYGAMGKLIEKTIQSEKDMQIVGIVALDQLMSLDDINEKVDVIIDFSNPVTLPHILDYAKRHQAKIVLATTGYTNSDIEKINNASTDLGIVYTANYSLGVTILNKILADYAKVLKQDFDIEIIEKHHNQKVDAPSGTAKMLLNTLDPNQEYNISYGRFGNKKREANEIGIHSIRGGSIVGEHQVIFTGLDETLELKHEAFSKMIFVKGAIKAIKFIVNQKKGLYNMEDVLGLK